jgi:hypothetical protein
MADYQLLDKKKHAKLRVATRYTAELGYNVGAVMLMNTELRAAQREYAIIFRKHPETGRFIPNALLGFKQDENLFLDGKGNWSAGHIPLAIAKGPFIIGFQNVGKAPQASACIDLADSRVSEGGEGEALFQKDGSLTRYMDYISQILLLLHDSTRSVMQMVDLFVELDLIEPLRLDIQFVNGEKLRLEGGYTVAEEKLAALNEEGLKKLHKTGFLSAAYFISGSLDNVQKLIDMKNKQFKAKAS